MRAANEQYDGIKIQAIQKQRRLCDWLEKDYFLAILKYYNDVKGNLWKAIGFGSWKN
jgi:hypothetical protein